MDSLYFLVDCFANKKTTVFYILGQSGFFVYGLFPVTYYMREIGKR